MAKVTPANEVAGGKAQISPAAAGASCKMTILEDGASVHVSMADLPVTLKLAPLPGGGKLPRNFGIESVIYLANNGQHASPTIADDRKSFTLAQADVVKGIGSLAVRVSAPDPPVLVVEDCAADTAVIEIDDETTRTGVVSLAVTA